MSRLVAYDLTRLFLGPLSISPRGIDRVDFALAKHFFSDFNSFNLGVLPTPWGIRCFDAHMVQKGIAHLNDLWSERIGEAADPLWEGVVARLRGEVGQPLIMPKRKALSRFAKVRRMMAHLWQTGVALGQPVSALPPGAIYLNVGQIGLSVPVLHHWLSSRKDITVAHLLHDAIPLEYPHLVSASSVEQHSRVVRTTAKYADLVITTTNHARASILTAIQDSGRENVTTYVRALPVPDALVLKRLPEPKLSECHYFLTCSTVEPRKNQKLLIDIWRNLVTCLGERAPHLVIVGSPGRQAEEILAPLVAEPGLAARVHHVSGLSSPALARLMLSAAAMLCPSYAEGFGLSVLEANALGVPTIASDIAAHGEVADATTILLPIDDLEAWKAAILSCGPAGHREQPAMPYELSETAYCADVEMFLRRFALAKGILS